MPENFNFSKIENLPEKEREEIVGVAQEEAEELAKEENKQIPIERILDTEKSRIEVFNIKNLIPKNVRSYIDATEQNRVSSIGYEEMIGIFVEAKNFINNITNGDFYNNERINHSGSLGLDASLHSDHSFREGRSVWFASGGSAAYRPDVRLTITNPFTQNFKKRVMAIQDMSGDYPFHDPLLEPQSLDYNYIMRKALKEASRDKLGGICITFFNYDNDEMRMRWGDLSDWIVDLPMGKLYKIKHLEYKKLLRLIIMTRARMRCIRFTRLKINIKYEFKRNQAEVPFFF